MQLVDILQLIVSGVAVGGIYALLALGFVLIYSVTGIINFTQGDFATIGAFVTISVMAAGIPLPVAGLAGIATAATVGSLLYYLVLRRFEQQELFALLLTIGASIFIEGCVLYIWGSQPVTLPPFSAGPPLSLAGVVMALQELWIFGLMLVAMAVLWLFLRRTYLGIGLRATMMNPRAVRLMGLSSSRMGLLAFFLSAALGGLAGITIAPVSLATYNMGLMLGLKGFVGAVAGGLVNPIYAVVCAVGLGVVESLVAGLVSSGYRDAVAFLVLVVVLVAKPSGIFTAVQTERF